jgi:hypothetical protein
MPQDRRYPDHAARQRAYRERQTQARHDELWAKGLPPLPPLPTVPGRARWQTLLAQAYQALSTAHDEMQCYYDDRSDAWQESDRAEALRDHLDALEQVLEALDDVPSW